MSNATIATVSTVAVSSNVKVSAAEKRIAKAIRVFAVPAGASIDIDATIDNFRAHLASAKVDFTSVAISNSANAEIDAVVVEIFAGATKRIPLPTLEMTVAVKLAKAGSEIEFKQIGEHLKSCLVQGRLSAVPGRAGGIALTDKFTVVSESEDSEEVEVTDCAAE